MDAGWGAYPDTVLHFPKADLRIDLRIPLARGLLERLADLGLSGSFAVITACNPLGKPLDPRANRALAAVFAQHVRERYPGAQPADGLSPDGSHREWGWAIPAPLPDMQQLAAQFLQNALFWFDGKQFFIAPVVAAGPFLPLPASGQR